MATTAQPGARPSTAGDSWVAAEARPFNLTAWLTGAGVLSIAMLVYLMATWVGSGDATRTATGPDPVPTMTKLWVWGYQLGGIVLLLTFTALTVRSWVRDRRISLVSAVFFGWLFSVWLDPATNNFIRPQLLYNSYAINLGSWAPHIPGWLSPNAHLLPEPIVAYTGVYGGQVLLALAGTAGMRWVRARRPGIGVVGLLATSLAVIAAIDVVLEIVLIRAQLWSYAGAIKSLSLWGGHTYQFPLYEPIVFGVLNTGVAAILFFKDDRGRSFVERAAAGSGRLEARPNAVRLLSVTGFITLIYIAYSVVFSFLAVYGGPYPDGLPSYLLNGMCGPGTQYECMGPEVPIPLPDSGPMPADRQ